MKKKKKERKNKKFLEKSALAESFPFFPPTRHTI